MIAWNLHVCDASWILDHRYLIRVFAKWNFFFSVDFSMEFLESEVGPIGSAKTKNKNVFSFLTTLSPSNRVRENENAFLFLRKDHRKSKTRPRFWSAKTSGQKRVECNLPCCWRDKQLVACMKLCNPFTPGRDFGPIYGIIKFWPSAIFICLTIAFDQVASVIEFSSVIRRCATKHFTARPSELNSRR